MEGFKQQEYSPVEKKYSTLIESELKSPRVVEAQQKVLDALKKESKLTEQVMHIISQFYKKFGKDWLEKGFHTFDFQTLLNGKKASLNQGLDILVDLLEQGKDQEDFLENVFVAITYLTEYDNIPTEVIAAIDKLTMTDEGRRIDEGRMIHDLLHSNPHLSKEK